MTTYYPIEELRLPMPWGHVAAKAWGFPNDKRILAVHGILDNAGTFDLLIPLLRRGYYFVCIDLPGHGFSSHFPATGALEYMDYILAITRIVDCLGWETFIWMGHSFGGVMGFLYAAMYPNKVEKLIGLDSDIVILVNNEQLGDHIRYLHDFSMQNEISVQKRLYAREEVLYFFMYTRWSTLNIAAAEALMKRSVTKVGDKYKWHHDPRLNFGLWPLLERDQYFEISNKFNIPACIIISDASLSNLDKNKLVMVSSELALKKKGLKFITVEGNHSIHINHPDRIVPHINQFLSNIRSNL